MELIENNINIIKYSKEENTRNMLPQRQFAIVKFEPQNILLLHTSSKQIYRYQQTNLTIPIRTDINHHTLLRPITFNNGLLYSKGKSTLATELEQRCRASQIVHFTQEEVVNTLIPIAQCIAHLHAQGIVHGRITPHAIIVTHQEDIKLADWLSDNPHAQHYYPSSPTQDDDWIAFGQVLAQTATLRKSSKPFMEKDTAQVAEGLLEKYSKGFIFALCVLLKRNKERFPHLLSYLRNDPKHINDLELNSLYDSLLREKARKKQALNNQNAMMQSSPPSLKPLSLHDSPARKPNNHPSLNSTLRRQKQEAENKKHPAQQDLKKKQIEKINKIIERSNEFVSELMARKNNDQILKKIAPKPNIANLSVYGQGPKKVKEVGMHTSSPTKKIRTISRKK